MIIKFKIAIFFIFTAITTTSWASNLCVDIANIDQEWVLKSKIKTYLKSQAGKLNLDSDRFKTANLLNSCSPNKYTKGLFLTFAGTGSFNPRVFNVLQKLIKCASFPTLSPNLQKNIYGITLNSLKDLKSNYTKWSATEAGPIAHLLRDEHMRQQVTRFDFATFPSEESELIANPENLSYEELKKIPYEISNSYNNTPRPIKAALNCTKQYIQKSDEVGYKDNKIIIITHSSGGRMVVKFLQQLKKYTNKDVDLVITIDPVKEAHEAIKEVIPQLAHRYTNNVLDYIPFYDPGYKEVNVWTRSQPHSLYKTSNSKRWINFYQNTDDDGLKMGVDFGIHGSPISGADHNYFIDDNLGSSAHGEIGYHDKVIEVVKDEIFELLN